MNDSLETILLLITNNTVVTIYYDNMYHSTVQQDTLSGLLRFGTAFSDHYYFVLSTLGLYKMPLKRGNSIKRLSFDPNRFPGYPQGIAGNGENDITVLSDPYLYIHYNGSTWQYELDNSYELRFRAIDQKENIVCKVGYNYQSPVSVKALIHLGIR